MQQPLCCCTVGAVSSHRLRSWRTGIGLFTCRIIDFVRALPKCHHPCTACTRSGGTYRLRSLQHGLHPCSPSCALTYKEHVPHFFTCFVFFAVVLILASFEADATLGLHYMHTVGFIHCDVKLENTLICLLYTSPSPRDLSTSRMPSSA